RVFPAIFQAGSIPLKAALIRPARETNRLFAELLRTSRYRYPVSASMPPLSENARWFAEHVQPHEPMLRAWLQNRFGTRCDIDDLVQEAYVRVLRAHQAGELLSPKAFLFATARNLALDYFRRHHVART